MESSQSQLKQREIEPSEYIEIRLLKILCWLSQIELAMKWSLPDCMELSWDFSWNIRIVLL